MTETVSHFDDEGFSAKILYGFINRFRKKVLMNVCPKLVVRRVRKGSESVEKLDKFYSKIGYLREIAINNEFTRAMVRRIS